MTSKNYEIPASWDDLTDEGWQTKPSDEISFKIEPQTSTLIGKCGNAFACVCGTGGGFALAHAGCAASYTLTFSGIGLATTFSASSVALATSLTATATGIGFWHFLRGKIAGPWERRLTIGGALAGAAMSLSLHFGGATGHLQSAEQSLEYYRSKTPEEQSELRQVAGPQSFMEFLMSICGPNNQPKP